MGRGPATCLPVAPQLLMLAAAPAAARQLSQPCVLKTPAIVDPREAPAAVANATAEAFAECSDLPETQSCDAIAADKAEVGCPCGC